MATQGETTMTSDAGSKPPAARDEELLFWRGHLGASFDSRLGGPLEWGRACPPKPVVDDPAKLLLCTESGTPRAVLVGASAAAPEMAKRHVERSLVVAEALPQPLRRVVLQAAEVGEVDGRSYVLWPYHEAPGAGRLAQWRWRRRMARPVADWLYEATAATQQPVAEEAFPALIAKPLSALAAMPGLGASLRAGVAQAEQDFAMGQARAVRVLMHNDLWTGNVLGPAPGAPREKDENPYGFVLIDWAGSEVAGYPAYDLTRWAQSVRMKPRVFGRELARHAEALGCSPGRMRAHLAVSLGYLAMHLEGFTPQRFARLADDCWGRMDQALQTLGVSPSG